MTTMTTLTESEIDDLLVAVVRELDHVSFVNIRDRMRQHIDVEGDVAMEIAPNIILWSGMSLKLYAAIDRCMKSQRIFAHPTTPLTYMVDGVYIRYPVARRPSEKGYQSPHWLPVVFRVVPIKRGRAA